MAINEKIYIGSVDTPTLSFNPNNIEDIVCNNAVDLIGNELSCDTLEVGVAFDDEDGVLRNTAYGTPIYYYSNDFLVGKYYVSKIERKGLKRYLIHATSLIGLIAKEDFYGGFYSGQNFSDIVNDVLLTNGLVLDKYLLYVPLAERSGSSYPHGETVQFTAPTYEYFKYKMYLDFTIVNAYSTVYTAEIAGNGQYFISIKPVSGNAFDIRLFYRDINYPALTLSSPKIGCGSRIIVDINPLAGTAYMSANYVNPSDPTDTGFIEASKQITIPSPSTGSYSMNKAYGASAGPSTGLTYYFQLLWNSFKIWDENGTLLIDPIFAVSVDGTHKYVINKCNGYVAETTCFVPQGEQQGMFGSFDRIERDVELMKSLVYASGVDNIKVHGWIQIGTRRDALHQLLFSQNVCMLKSDNGGVLFTTLSGQTVGSIEDDDIYDDPDEASMSVAKSIKVTENTFEQTTGGAQVLFDNSNNTLIEGQYIAIFDTVPIYGTPAGDGITLLHNNCNCALVTGRGKITGTPYKQSQNVISFTNNDVSDGSDVSINGIGLITSRNSDYIMSKLKAYYSGALKKITNGIKYHGERCGLKYLFKTLYADENNAFLIKINAKASSFVKANCEFVYGYVPPSSGAYTEYAICTYGETWIVPQAVHDREYQTLRLNLIGKGHDGTAGTNGTDGNLSESGSGKRLGGTGGAGGSGGLGGAGGSIYSLTLDVTNVSYLTVEVSGLNTIVKTYNSSDVLLNTYSSATGNPSDAGFLNIFNGMYYARKGIDGVGGAGGGTGGTAWRKNEVESDYIDPTVGGDVDVYTGGTCPRIEVHTQDEYGTQWYYYNSYGGGGGAAYGTNGGNSRKVSRTGARVVTAGGNGANAITPQNTYTEYGSGGFGGHGGGGGGGAGTVFKWPNLGTSYEPGSATSQQKGLGGLGSAGTPGIDGCAIIYY